jgi:hypothetical protein
MLIGFDRRIQLARSCGFAVQVAATVPTKKGARRRLFLKMSTDFADGLRQAP